MSSRVDRRVMIRFILLYHDLSILTLSSLPLISHFTISVLPFSFPCHFTYDTTFDFPCVLVFHMSLYEGWSHPSLISIGSDLDIFFFFFEREIILSMMIHDYISM